MGIKLAVNRISGLRLETPYWLIKSLGFELIIIFLSAPLLVEDFVVFALKFLTWVAESGGVIFFWPEIAASEDLDMSFFRTAANPDFRTCVEDCSDFLDLTVLNI